MRVISLLWQGKFPILFIKQNLIGGKNNKIADKINNNICDIETNSNKIKKENKIKYS